MLFLTKRFARFLVCGTPILGARPRRCGVTAWCRPKLDCRLLAFMLVLGALLSPLGTEAAPYVGRRTFTYRQPDGSTFPVKVYGDEFFAYERTLTGHQIGKDPESGFWCYAALSGNGKSFVSTGVPVVAAAGGGAVRVKAIPKEAAVKNPLLPNEVRRSLVSQAQAKFRVDSRGRQLPSRNALSAATAGATLPEGAVSPRVAAPPGDPTLGDVVGLCILVDFSDQVGTIPQSDIDDLCNQPSGFTGFGNACSVNEYFRIQSDGRFNFTNIVTAYVRVPHPKTYYDDGSDRPWGSNRGQDLVRDALDVLIAADFDFTLLSLDSSNTIRSLNIFYAGTVTSGWNTGLWPHKWDIPTKTVDAANGIKAEAYQMSDLTSSPDIGTFSHENGHLTCGFPDLYNYDNGESVVGDFSLMSAGSHGGGGKHPTSIDPYLKNSAGWATMTDLAPTDHLRVSAQRDRNHYYRIVNPAEPREYIVFEARDDTGYEGPYGGHAASVCPGQGIVAWHVFEGGSNTHPWVTKPGGPVYEALILEASPTTAFSPWYTDPSLNAGLSDAFHAGGGADPLDDASTPSLKFWDQALHTRSVASGFTIHSPSVSGPTMTYVVGPGDVTAAPRIGLTSVGIAAACDLGSDAADQIFAVLNAGGGTLAYSISDDAPWLSCSPASGTATIEADEIVVSFSTSALAAGTYSATITVVAAGASNTPQTILVTLTVRAAPIVSVSDLSISCPSEDSFFVGNAGGGTMAYTVTDDSTWLSLSRASGSVGLEQDEIVLTCDPTGLTPRTTYHAVITVTAAGAANSPIMIPVSFLVPIANPTSFAAVSIGGSRIDLSWSPNPDFGEVMVAWSTTSAFGAPAGTYSVGDPIAGGGTVLYRGSATTMSHTGLMPGTTYYYTAWSVGAGPAFSAGVAVSESTGVSVPYTQDFESGGMSPGGWIQEQVVGSIAWTFRDGGEEGHPAGAHGGSYNAHLYDANYSDTTTRLITPVIDFGTATENAQLTFWHCMEDWGGDQDELRVLYRTSAIDEWVLLDTYTSSVPFWTQRTLALPEPGGTYYIAFEGKVNFGYGVCIDDVQITGNEPGAPRDFSAAPVSSSRIGLSWNLNLDADDVLVAWSTSPVFGTPTGAYSVGDSISGGGTVLYGGSATTAQHTGLAVGATYYYRAWSRFPDGSYSAGVACSGGTASAIPYTEDFENGGAIPAGWTQEQVTGTVGWTFQAGGEEDSPAAAHGGGYNARLFDGDYVDNTTRLITPAIDFGTAVENAQLTFWHCMEGWFGDQDELRVLYRTSPGGPWTLLASYTASVPSWTQRTLALPDPGGIYYIAFEGKVNYGYGVCIDDVRITGDEPGITPGTFVATPAATSRIDLSWNLNLDSDDVLVAWSTDPVFGTPVGTYSVGDPISGGGMVLYRGGATAASHTGLAAGIPYYYQAWSLLPGGGFSAGVACSASTAPSLTVPFTEGFENSGLVPTGWTQQQIVGTADWAFRSGGTFGYPSRAHGGIYNARLSTNLLDSHTVRLISPMIDFGVAVQDTQLTFWHCMEGWDVYQDELRVLYRTSADGPWTVLATYVDSVPSWTQRTIDLPSPGGSYYIAFEGTANYGYGVCVDDVQIRGNEPGAPRNFSVASAGTFRIDLSWDLNADADDVLVAWSATPVFGTPAGTETAGDPIAGGGTVLYRGTATAASHTGLPSGTTYYYRAWSIPPGAAFSTGVYSATTAISLSVPFTEGFEHGGLIPAGWTQQQTVGTAEWTFLAGSFYGDPVSAHGGTYNANLASFFADDNKTRLVTPLIDFGAAAQDTQLTFWHCMVGDGAYQDELRVFYRTSTAGSWTLLETYATSVASWTQRTLALPDPGSSYYLAFEGNARFGYGVCIDDVQVTGKGDQSITFAAFPATTYGDPDVALGATASSGYAVTYVSSNPGVATIVGDALHIVGAGASTITASQAGDATWSAATPVQRTLTVDPARLTCTADDKKRTYGSVNPPLTITYTGLQNADLAPAAPPVIACAATATSPAGPYDITLTGGSDPNYTLALVDGTLTVSLGVTMRLWVDDGGRISELEFGEADSATNGIDPAWDVLAAGPPADGVYAYLSTLWTVGVAEQDLSCDYHALADTSRWRLVVSGLAARGSITLAWDVALAEAGREVYLQRIEDEQCVGAPIDMRELGQLELTEDAVFEVVYSIPVTTRISLGLGWNLIGSPVISTQSGKDAFDDGTRAPSYVGSAWHWRGLRYQSWNEGEPLCPERGLWMHCLRDDQTADMTGVQADGVVLLQPGWNLVTPVADCTMPAAPGLGTSAWYWDSGSGAYQRIAVGEPVLAGRGYWFYVSPGAPIILQLGE